MKKIITAAVAVLAMSLAFVSCGFTDGAAEPQYDYQTIEVDLEEYSNTDLGWYPTFEMPGSDFAALKGVDNPKITFVVTGDEGASYYQVGVQYGNGSVGSWGVYDGKIYDEEGNVISVNDSGIFQNKSTFVLKPEAKQIESLLDRGLVLQGDNATLTSVTIEYVGDEAINTTIRNMAKADGTFSGDGEILLDPDDANISVLTITSEGKNVDSTYKFTGSADLSDVTSVTLNARTSYDYVANTSTGAVSKESNYVNGSTDFKYTVYAKWSYSIAKEEITSTNSNNEVNPSGGTSLTTIIPKGAIYNPWNVAAGPAKIVDFFAEYSDANAIAYSDINTSDYQSGVLGDGYVYDAYYDSSDTSTTSKKITEYDYNTIETDNLYLTLFTDDNNASSVYYTGSFSADYADLTFKVADLVQTGSKGKVDLAKVAGIKISTNLSEGTLYIKTITF